MTGLEGAGIFYASVVGCGALSMGACYCQEHADTSRIVSCWDGLKAAVRRWRERFPWRKKSRTVAPLEEHLLEMTDSDVVVFGNGSEPSIQGDLAFFSLDSDPSPPASPLAPPPPLDRDQLRANALLDAASFYPYYRPGLTGSHYPPDSKERSTYTTDSSSMLRM